MNKKPRLTKAVLDHAAYTVINRDCICTNMEGGFWVDQDAVNYKAHAFFVNDCFPEADQEDVLQTTTQSINLWSKPSAYGFWTPFLPKILKSVIKEPDCTDLTLLHYMLLLSNSEVFAMVAYLMIKDAPITKKNAVKYLMEKINDSEITITTADVINSCLNTLEELGLITFDGVRYEVGSSLVDENEVEMLQWFRQILAKYFSGINLSVAEYLLKPFKAA